MKFNRLMFFVAFFLFLFNLGSVNAQDQIEKGFNCFSMIAGKNTTVDGAVLFAHNEDDGGPQLVNYYKVPRLKHEAGTTITLATGAVIPQVSETNEYFWYEMPNMSYSDSYINEWGVAIGSDQCRSREDQPEFTDGGIGYWLRRLVAERAKTAKHGVRIAGKLIHELGYASSGRSYMIVDTNEGWMLSAVKGKHWVAQRVPDDMVVIIPNYYTIGEVDLSDTTKFLGSPDLIEYAIKRGWYNPEKDGEFHFSKVYAQEGSRKHPGNVQRMWRGINLISEKKYSIDDEFPFAVKPPKKISKKDFMVVLRDHYEGTEFDKTKLGCPYKMNGRTICANSTQYGFIAELRSWLPVEIGCVVWLAQRRPDSQPFIPWYLGMQKIPENYAYGDYNSALTDHFNPVETIHERNDKHAFWAYANWAESIDNDYGKRIKKVKKKYSKVEKEIFGNQKSFEKRVKRIYEQNPQKAKELLTKYTEECLDKAMGLMK